MDGWETGDEKNGKGDGSGEEGHLRIQEESRVNQSASGGKHRWWTDRSTGGCVGVWLAGWLAS